MHTHCEASPDSATSIEDQARAIREALIDVVCATDHNTIEGARRLEDIAVGFRVIVGEEIGSREGEIIGLFLDNAIPPGLSAEETIARIKAQGGLVIVPHPFTPSRPQQLRRQTLDRLWPQIDGLEVLNGREEFPSDNRKAAAYARERGIPGTAGSDAHRATEVGRAYVEVEDFASPEELLHALRTGVVRIRRTSPIQRLVRLSGLGGQRRVR
jgi:predicted metal-dependent phosphoesterase TrpH